MNRTIQEVTVNKYFYRDYKELNVYLVLFLRAYNCGKRLKTVKGLTPYEFMIRMLEAEPERAVAGGCPHTLGPYI
jgi:hypothetical protein